LYDPAEEDSESARDTTQAPRQFRFRSISGGAAVNQF